MKKALSLLLLVTHFFCFAQLTYIPDDNFEYYIETHDINGFSVPEGDPQSMGNGIIGDNYVSSEKIANAFEIYPEYLGITDLTGINEFTSLFQLYIYGNEITNLQVSLPSLWTIGCSNNLINSIDISGCTGLENLVCSNNFLADIDLSLIPSLSDVNLNNNLLSGHIDLTNNNRLTYFEIRDNNIESIDLRNRTTQPFFGLDARNNPDLNCVYLDDISVISDYDYYIDSTANFVETEEQCNNLSIEDLELSNSTSIFPNPSNGIFNINTNQHITLVEVFDLSGKKMYQSSVSEFYNISDIAKGMYFLRISTENETIVRKIVVE